MLWLKAFHIVFVVTWFAGLFYLPRLFASYFRSGISRTFVYELLDEFADPTAGFCPTQSMPLTPPSSIFSIVA